MTDKQLYEQILSIKSPWRVETVDVSVEGGEDKVHVQAKAESRHRCPQCGKRCAGHDRRVQRWRHLNTCQLKTTIEAEVPRGSCAEYGVVMVVDAMGGTRGGLYGVA